MYRVMVVCTGNICRSPMAEAVLRDRFARAGLADRVVVDSSGTSDEEHGGPVDRRAAAVLRRAGLALPDHRARQVDRADVGGRDLLLAMTGRHARVLRALAPDAASAGRVHLYRSFDPAAPAGDLDVADPWYGDEDGFTATLAEVQAAADGVVDHVRAELDQRDRRDRLDRRDRPGAGA